jgi:DNA-binding response OmpR family regulator
VLLVEDERLISALLEEVLTDAGHSVTAATDGDAALFAAATQPPSAAVLDWSIPGTSGLRLMRELRALVPDLPMVVISGHEPSSIDLGEFGAAADGPGVTVLEKPFDPQQLVATLGAAAPLATPAPVTSVSRR